MKKPLLIGSVVVVLIVLAGAIMWMQSGVHAPAVPVQPTDVTTTTAASTGDATSATATGTERAAPAAAALPTPKSFTVNGNDATADVKVITVAKGTPVTITFGADSGTTYHGGLDFRSSVVNTGTIPPGTTKTVAFTATHSFAFTPYWPSTNIAKPYVISIVVQ